MEKVKETFRIGVAKSGDFAEQTDGRLSKKAMVYRLLSHKASAAEVSGILHSRYFSALGGSAMNKVFKSATQQAML